MDEQRLRKRFAELTELSRRQNIYHYTEFLTPAEAADARAMTPEKEYCAFGGAADCERVIVRFGEPAQIGYEEPFPVSVLKIEPVSRKFAEALTHRDYLGALMHLGLERSVFGDILVREQTAYVFIQEHMAEYVCGELTAVRHTQVRCTIPDEVPEEAKPRLEEEQIIVSSLRLDNIIAKVWHLSRTRAKELFAVGSVQIGGRVCEKESAVPRTGDIISVRGYGKFRLGEKTGSTKKGSDVVSIGKYI